MKILLLTLILLTGCGPETVWFHPDKNTQTFHKDNSGCMSQAGAGETQSLVSIPGIGRNASPTLMSVSSGNWGAIYDECMMGNGWVLVEKK